MMPRLLKFAPVNSDSGSVIAYLSVELPSGLVIHDLKLMRGPSGAPWIAMPSIQMRDRQGEPMVDANGKKLFRQIVECRDRTTRDRFSAAVLQAIEREHPEMLLAAVS